MANASWLTKSVAKNKQKEIVRIMLRTEKKVVLEEELMSDYESWLGDVRYQW